LKIDHQAINIQGMRILPRPRLDTALKSALRRSPAAVLLGPRQCGKTTLARRLAASTPSTYFDLERPTDLARLENPVLTLQSLRGLVIIDEVQRRPDLFPVLRTLLDRRPVKARFLLLGSASPELLAQSSETLAGRVAFVAMSGFTVPEIAAGSSSLLWLRGGYPNAFLARSHADSFAWRQDFIQTFLERDLAQLGSRVPAPTMRRFWAMLAHHSGGIWNSSEIGRSLGDSHTTVRRHLDTLAGALMVRILQPWHANLGKRQVKSPKVYVRDTGLLHALLGIESRADLESHPKLGASWEGFVIEQILAQPRPPEAYYWRTQAGAELDLLIRRRGRFIGIEAKYADAPTLTPSMRHAVADLGLQRLLVVYPGSERYRLAPGIDVVPLADCLEQ
jgi:predicted AAA+ superfamily ATPase